MENTFEYTIGNLSIKIDIIDSVTVILSMKNNDDKDYQVFEYLDKERARKIFKAFAAALE